MGAGPKSDQVSLELHPVPAKLLAYKSRGRGRSLTMVLSPGAAPPYLVQKTKDSEVSMGHTKDLL